MAYYSPNDDISFEPLTLEEEGALFKRFHEDNDLSARDTLIAKHLKLVAKLALRQARGCMPDEDAISAGNFGLLQALESKRFDPTRNCRFSSYVRAYVRGQVLLAIRARINGDPRPNREVTPEATLTSAALLMAHQRVKEFSSEDEILVDHGYEGQQLIEVRKGQIERAIAKLPKLEAVAVRGTHFGEKNFADIARENGLSREGVRKAYHRGVSKLKSILASMKAELN